MAYRRLGQEESRDDMHAMRPSSPMEGAARPMQRIRSFTTEDLPRQHSDINPVQKATTEMLQTSKLVLMKGIRGMNVHKDTVVKMSSDIVDKVKKTFTLDESEHILRADWQIVETEEDQLLAMKEVLIKLEKAFQFSNTSSTLGTLATNTLKSCEELVERSLVHIEQCNMMFLQCSNEISTITDYLSKLRDAVNPPVRAKDKNEEKKNARRAEWAISRMAQSVQSMVLEMRENLDELDDLTSECTKLMVQAITLLHMRGRSADFSGTGVAAGAAGVVAGAVVGVAGIIAAPATGGLSIPISIAGKGLFFTGVAALTPSSIMLSRQSQQLSGLVKLVEHLKSRLEIMNQKREEMAIAYSACEILELNITQAGNFCQDAIELEIPTFESSWTFIDDISSKLTTLNTSVTLFLASPSLWHYCKSEDELRHYLLAEDEDE